MICRIRLDADNVWIAENMPCIRRECTDIRTKIYNGVNVANLKLWSVMFIDEHFFQNLHMVLVILAEEWYRFVGDP